MSTSTARHLTSSVGRTKNPTSSMSAVMDAHGPSAAVQPARKSFDHVLLLATMVLMGLGTVMVYSASIGVADMRFGDPSLYLRKHLVHVAIALFALGGSLLLSYRHYRRTVYLILGTALLLLVLLVAGFGINRGYSTRWIGPQWAEFQPSEFAKLAFVIYLAYSLEKKATKMTSFTIGFLPHLIVCGLLIILCLAQPDLGACLLLAAVMFVMLYIGGTRVSYMVGVCFVAIWMAVGYIAQSSSRLSRIDGWLNPWADRYDAGFQTVNALTSLGSGGIWGMGLGEGRQKMGYLTQGWSDFIFASVGEELGLVGCVAVVLVFGVICWRGFRIARQAPDYFSRYLAFGISCLIGGQAAFNMGVAVGIIPTKGLNLPFVSGGGSSLIVSCLAVGILLNISTWVGNSELRRSRLAARKKPDPEPKRKQKKPIAQKDSGVRIFVRGQGGSV